MDDLVSVPACNMTSGADFSWKVDTFIPAASMSAARNSYLDLFLLLASMMFLVKGMVSSTNVTVGGFVELSIVTRSGLCAVITNLVVLFPH